MEAQNAAVIVHSSPSMRMRVSSAMMYLNKFAGPEGHENGELASSEGTEGYHKLCLHRA